MELIKSLFMSSANPENISLFVKGAVSLSILLGLDSTVVTQLGNEIISFATNAAVLVASGVSIFGLIRKLTLGRWSAA